MDLSLVLPPSRSRRPPPKPVPPPDLTFTASRRHISGMCGPSRPICCPRLTGLFVGFLCLCMCNNYSFSVGRFLPCNSHHIRENTDRASTETASTRNAASANNAGSNNSNSGATPTVATSQPSARELLIHFRLIEVIINDKILSTAPPESLSSLPFNLFGSQFTLGDFEQIVPNPNTLNRVRDSLQVYVVDNLFSGQAISDSTMQDVSLLCHLSSSGSSTNISSISRLSIS